ncbi:MAG: hypothetical protein D3923_09060 [Candidatus Electrothrix sp. AR3]|nr:hypothetical protein [Candidatus Electrothrix sp. AR3]
MIEKVGTIKNPLTIIAIFAAIAEGAGFYVLSSLEPEIQKTFILFVMWFPILLVSLFFITLNFNSKVLYAPSDFKDETNFISLVKKVDQVASDVGKLSKRVSIVLQCGGEKIELPLELRLADFSRMELLGRIGMLPLKKTGRRFTIGYLHTSDFLCKINEIRESVEDGTLIIPCTEEELQQFDVAIS